MRKFSRNLFNKHLPFSVKILLSINGDKVRGLLVISVYLGVQSMCLAQVTHRSQAGGTVAKGSRELLSAPKVSTTSKSADKAETEIVAEKVILVPKIAPAGVDINYLPLFGHYEKTESQLVSDEMFLSECDREFKSRKEAGDFFNKMAWQYLSEGDKSTATYRFNLAYLLHPENIDIYWGLGVIEFQNGNYSQAIDLMDQGLALSDGKNYVFMTDLATVYIKKALGNTHSVIESQKAKDLLHKALLIQPQYTPAYVQLTVVSLVENDLDLAWENFHKAYELNPAELSKDVLMELLSRKDDPKGIFKKN
jgi:tetratricopeptide (TPR) repeat protein